jgi:hypothetical protein
MNDWLQQVVTQISSVTVSLAIMAAVGKMFFGHVLKADIEHLKAELRDESNRLKTGMETSAATDERLRKEVVRWANPILNAVNDLDYRLRNILEDEGYKALDSATPSRDPNWSMTYDYFLDSTLYLFGQYFCQIHLLRQELSFELFGTHEKKGSFADAILAVEKGIGDYSESFKFEGDGNDRQVFRFQQRAIGELLTNAQAKPPSCVAFPSYLTRKTEPQFVSAFDPLKQLVDKLKPGERRWARLRWTRGELAKLRTECEKLLQLKGSA